MFGTAKLQRWVHVLRKYQCFYLTSGFTKVYDMKRYFKRYEIVYSLKLFSEKFYLNFGPQLIRTNSGNCFSVDSYMITQK